MPLDRNGALEVEMAAIKISEDGFAMNVEDEIVVAVAGPRPSGRITKSYFFVAGYAPIAFTENFQSVIKRMGITPATFAMLTRPNATQVWIRGNAVKEIRDPWTSELQDPPNVTRAVVGFSGFHQAVQESISDARPVLITAGTNPQLFDGLVA